MSINKLILNRRLFLQCGGKGLAALVGLPYLSSIYDNSAYAQNLNSGKALRFLCMYHPHGVMQTNPANNIDGYSFFPKRNSDTNYNLMQSSVRAIEQQGLKNHATLIEGMSNEGGSGNPHMRGISAFLTGAVIPNDGSKNDKTYTHKRSFDTHFADIFAKDLTNKTLFLAGNSQLDKPNPVDYYNPLKNALSWDKSGKLRNANMAQKRVFDGLVQGSSNVDTQKEIRKREQMKISVLDTVKEARDELNRRINSTDKSKLDDYYTRLRELERKLIADQTGPSTQPNTCSAGNRSFNGVKNHTFQEMIHNLDNTVNNAIELIALAFTCDKYRSICFMFSGEASETLYQQANVNAKIHGSLSHYTKVNNIDNTTKKHRQVDRYHAEKIAEMAKKLNDIKEADGKSILHNSVIVSGSGLGTGYNHSLKNLPMMILGHGGGGIRGGRFLNQNGKKTGVLYSSILKAMGVQNVAFGDNRNGSTFQL